VIILSLCIPAPLLPCVDLNVIRGFLALLSWLIFNKYYLLICTIWFIETCTTLCGSFFIYLQESVSWVYEMISELAFISRWVEWTETSGDSYSWHSAHALTSWWSLYSASPWWRWSRAIIVVLLTRHAAVTLHRVRCNHVIRDVIKCCVPIPVQVCTNYAPCEPIAWLIQYTAGHLWYSIRCQGVVGTNCRVTLIFNFTIP